MVRGYDWVLDALATIAAVLILLVMVAVGVEVGARYLFNRPTGWIIEASEHGLILILFLGIPWVAREQGHVAIEILIDHVPRSARRVLRVMANALAALVALFLTYWAVLATLDNYRRGVETYGIYPIQKYLLILAATVGLGLTGIEFVRRAVIAAHREPPEPGAPETLVLEP
jgi:C4-dicarboxylate transporter, DctQ subunit